MIVAGKTESSLPVCAFCHRNAALVGYLSTLVLWLVLFLAPVMASAADWESLAGRLAAERIGYAKPWYPPGEEKPWVMDCSNAVRWMLREGSGALVPRTSSAQYEFFRQRGRLRRVPADPRRLMRELKAGDLLFWEHTHRPTRKHPVTHVMMYLGRDRWWAPVDGGFARVARGGDLRIQAEAAHGRVSVVPVVPPGRPLCRLCAPMKERCELLTASTAVSYLLAQQCRFDFH